MTSMVRRSTAEKRTIMVQKIMRAVNNLLILMLCKSKQKDLRKKLN